jgi:hypothetical protein
MKPGDSFVVGTMELAFKSSERRAELSAVMIVAVVLQSEHSPKAI